MFKKSIRGNWKARRDGVALVGAVAVDDREALVVAIGARGDVDLVGDRGGGGLVVAAGSLDGANDAVEGVSADRPYAAVWFAPYAAAHM